MGAARLVGAAAIVLVASGASAYAGSIRWSEDDLVHCYDRTRDLVRRLAADACPGEIVGAEEAARLRASRINHVQRSLGARPPLVPGKKLGQTGTGFFVSNAGHVLTNWHVVHECAAVSIETARHTSALAELVASHVANDLALLRVDLDVPAAATFRKPSQLTNGESVAVVGYPFHGRVAIRPILTNGHVTGIDEPTWPDATRFRINADIRNGNSGGPVLDDNGLVIGVVTAKVDTPKMFQLTGRVIRHVGLVIDRSAVFRFLGRHGVTVRLGRPGPGLGQDDLVARGRSIVAQVGCWK